MKVVMTTAQRLQKLLNELDLMTEDSNATLSYLRTIRESLDETEESILRRARANQGVRSRVAEILKEEIEATIPKEARR